MLSPLPVALPSWFHVAALYPRPMPNTTSASAEMTLSVMDGVDGGVRSGALPVPIVAKRIGEQRFESRELRMRPSRSDGRRVKQS